MQWKYNKSASFDYVLAFFRAMILLKMNDGVIQSHALCIRNSINIFGATIEKLFWWLRDGKCRNQTQAERQRPDLFRRRAPISLYTHLKKPRVQVHMWADE